MKTEVRPTRAGEGNKGAVTRSVMPCLLPLPNKLCRMVYRKQDIQSCLEGRLMWARRNSPPAIHFGVRFELATHSEDRTEK